MHPVRNTFANLVVAGFVLALSVAVVAVSGARADTDSTKEAAPLVTDRPDFTESAETVSVGRVQVESGYTFTRNGHDGEHGVGEVLIRVPMSTKSEVRVGLPSYVVQRGPSGRASGWSDAFLGAKFVLSAGGDAVGFKRPAMAVLVGTTLPTGSRAFREDKFQPEAIFAASVNLSGSTALSSNVGYARASDAGARFSQFFASVSLGHSLTDRLGAYAELYGFTDTNAQGDRARYFDSGLSYLLNNDRQIDVRAGIGLNNNIAGSDYFLGAGLSQRF
jgi:hypothetical protein